MAGEPLDAAYWVSRVSLDGTIIECIWRCYECNAIGIAPTEGETVQAMNSHVSVKHPGRDYSAPPIPA
jgi:hypothetical protein